MLARPCTVAAIRMNIIYLNLACRGLSFVLRTWERGRGREGIMDAIGVYRQKLYTVCELVCFLCAWAVGMLMALSDARDTPESHRLAEQHPAFEDPASLAEGR